MSLSIRTDIHCVVGITSAHIDKMRLKQQLLVTVKLTQAKTNRCKTKQLTPQVINNIELADLREEASDGFVVLLPVFDGPRPVLKTRGHAV